jgi:hypothetical protein
MPDAPRFLGDPPPQDAHELIDARPARYLVLYTASSGLTLDRAGAVLRESGFVVEARPPGLRARWRKGPELRLAIVDPAAAVRSVRGACDDDAVFRALEAVDTVIEVTFDDLHEALDEANTLIESQMQLQAASGGVLCLCWNGAMTLPE